MIGNKRETLYCKRQDRTTQQWEVELVGNKYRTHSGVFGGAQVTSEWTVVQGKNIGRGNETTPEIQARMEVDAMIEHRLARKYRRTIKELDTVADEFFQPMLAVKFEDVKDLRFPVFAQPKLDGKRCIAMADGLFSRQGKRIVSCPHIEEALKEFFEEFPEAILDGELYADKLAKDFNAIMSIVSKTKPTAMDAIHSANTIKYHIYDCPSDGYGDESQKFAERTEWLRDNLPGLADFTSPLVEVATYTARDLKQLDDHFKRCLEDNYEGQMIRLDLPYECGKRSKSLIKRKSFQDDEFKIVKIHEGVGNRAGMAGRVDCQTKDGKVFGVDPMGDREYRRELLRNAKSIVGKMGTVVFFDYTPPPGSVPRFGKLKAVKHPD